MRPAPAGDAVADHLAQVPLDAPGSELSWRWGVPEGMGTMQQGLPRRTMISFPIGAHRFHSRAAAIVVDAGYMQLPRHFLPGEGAS